jgi:YVTN family beta-propeller protein
MRIIITSIFLSLSWSLVSDAEPFAYITNGVIVSVIDLSTNTVIDTIDVGDEPYGVAVSPDGNLVYITDLFDATVSVIRTSDNAVIDTINVGLLPYGVAATPDGNFIYVTNHADANISVIRTADNTVVDTIGVDLSLMVSQ